MPSIKRLDTQTALNTTPTTVTLSETGAHQRATFVADMVTLAGGSTWTVDFKWKPAVGGSVTIATATLTGGTAAVFNGVFNNPFSSTNRAVPAPNQLVYTRTVGTGALTASVYAMYGD